MVAPVISGDGISFLGTDNLATIGNGGVPYGSDKPAFIMARSGHDDVRSGNWATPRFAVTTAGVESLHADSGTD